MFECDYCSTKFVTDKEFNKHTCREQDRLKELTTPKGITAFKYYTLWFSKRELLKPAKDSFISSRFYNVFLKFNKFVKSMGIPDIELYIQFMCRENILPAHWANADIYEYFMEYFDNECPIKKHIVITAKTLDKLTDILECEMSEVFTNMHASDMANLIQSRNLSPWVLLLSPKFREYLINDVTHEQRKLIESVIKVNRWKAIIESNRKSIPETKKIIKELGL